MMRSALVGRIIMVDDECSGLVELRVEWGG